jgi:hypothetical protein
MGATAASCATRRCYPTCKLHDAASSHADHDDSGRWKASRLQSSCHLCVADTQSTALQRALQAELLQYYLVTLCTTRSACSPIYLKELQRYTAVTHECCGCCHERA